MPACPRCQTDIGSDLRFCPACGQALGPGGEAERPEADGRGPLGERRVVTVLFCDIDGIAALQSTFDPEAVVSMLNALLGAVAEPIYRYGGVVDKYIGHVVMALFGAPIAHEDDPERALMAAWEMGVALARFNRRLHAEVDVSFRARIGVNTGLVVAGEVGGDEKNAYTVMGDPVNVAQRMQANARPGAILVTGATRRLAGERFVFQPVPPIKVKNRAEPVEAFELAGLATGPPPATDALVGRDPELAALRAAWLDASLGRPAIVVLAGDAGSGKTAILRTFMADLPSGVTLVHAAPSSYECHVPLHLARNVLRSVLGLESPGDVPPERLRHALAQLDPDLGPDRETADLVAFVLAGKPLAHLGGLDPEHLQAMAFLRISEILQLHARASPLALVVDNLHWADSASLAWLETLMMDVAIWPSGLLLVLALRPMELSLSLPGAPDVVRTLALSPLGDFAARDLLAMRLGPLRFATVADEWLSRVLELGTGNPGFLVALSETLPPPDNTGRGLRRPGALPTSVAMHFAAHLDALALSEPAARVLAGAAVLGLRMEKADLADLFPEQPIAPALAELLADLVLTEEGPASSRLAFTAPLLQEVAYERTLVRRRRDLHERAAGVLSARAAEPSLLAEHFERAGMPGQAARFALVAAEQALAYYANREAAEFADRALGWAARAEAGDLPESAGSRAQRVRAHALAALGRPDGALAACTEVVKLARNPAERSEAYLLQAQLLLRKGDLEGALATCERGLEAVAGYALGRLELLARRAQVRMRRGESDAALADCREVLQQAPAEEARLRGYALFVAGGCHYRLSDLQEARTAYEAAIAACEESGDLYQQAHALSDLGATLGRLGRPDAAFERFSAGLDLARRIGDRRLRGVLLNNLAMLVANQGDWEGARRYFEEALELYRGTQDRLSAAIAELNLGEVWGTLGDPAKSEALLTAAIADFEAAGGRDHLGHAYLQLSLCRHGQGDLSGALTALQAGHRVAADTGQRDLQGMALRMISEIHQTQGNLDQAETWARNSVEALRHLEDPRELARAYEQWIRVLDRLDRPGDMAAVRRQAESDLARLQAEHPA